MHSFSLGKCLCYYIILRVRFDLPFLPQANTMEHNCQEKEYKVIEQYPIIKSNDVPYLKPSNLSNRS